MTRLTDTRTSPSPRSDEIRERAGESGHRDYSGCFFKFRIPSSGIVVDGIVVEMNESREYICQVILVPMRTSDDMYCRARRGIAPN